MSRRALLRLVVGVLLVTALVWLLRPTPPGSRITFANYQRIQTGMTEAEVNELLGGPPGAYWSEPGFILVGPGHIPRDEHARGGKLEVWYADGFHIEVLYGRDGRVLGKYWHGPDS